MKRNILISFVFLSIFSHCSKTSEHSFLILCDTIKLELTDQSALSHVAEFIATDSSFIILDIMSNLVHEFSNTGKFMQTFGRHGQGPGEYKRPKLIETDNAGNVVIFDQASMKLNVYKRNGAFIRDLNANKKISWSDGLKIDNDGNLLQLISYNGIHQLKKYNSPNLDRVYSVSLSDEKTNAVVTHFGIHTGFTYNPENNRLYYINPCDFQIQEIDAKTGNIVKSFGIKPPDYRPLSGKFQSVGEIGDPGKLTKILNETTFVLPPVFFC